MKIRWTPARARWATMAVAAALVPLVPLAPRAAPAAEPFVLGQSLPVTGAMAQFSRQVIGGTQAYVEHVNANGGIQGRPVRLVTLDDGGDPARHEANLRTLVQESRAIALLNCADDASCLRAAKVAAEADVPLVGPRSGLRALRAVPHRHVVAVRAGYDREAAALSRQLRSMGLGRVVVLTEAPDSAEHLAELRSAFQREGIVLSALRPAGRQPAQLQALLDGVQAAKAQALVFDLGAGTLDEVVQLKPEVLLKLPRVLASLANPAVSNLVVLFREQVIGFTTVVPNPEIPSSRLVRDFEAHSARHGSGTASFEGLEAYVNARICLDALRAAGPRASPQALTAAIWQLGQRDLGGYTVVLDPQRPGASDWVEIALRSRAGTILK